MQLDEDTLARRRRDLGEDHPDTLAAASNLAVSLRAAGEYQAARELDEDTLARRRRVLGEDHPDTLASAHGLAISLRAVGGHPGTLTSASNLAAIVRHPASTRRPGSWAKTPWPAAAASWARTTPTPWPPPTAWPSACVRSASARRPGS